MEGKTDKRTGVRFSRSSRFAIKPLGVYIIKFSELKGLLKGITSCFGISRDPKPPERVKSTIKYSNGDEYTGRRG